MLQLLTRGPVRAARARVALRAWRQLAPARKFKHARIMVDAAVETWEREGYAILPRVFTPQEIAALREIVDSCLHQFNGSTSAAEPGGYGPENDSSWIVLHLNHPKYHQGRQQDLARLLDSICHPTLVRTLHGMFRGDFYLAQCNLYKDPPTWGKHSWHRDAQFFASGRLEGKPISDPDELERRERELIATEASPPRDLHMHIPLESTQPNAGCASAVVPGSFGRWDTAAERRVRVNDPSAEMPGQLRLSMNPGDVGFFHVNALHRGPSAVDGDDRHVRRTIAVTWTDAARPSPITNASMVARTGYVAPYQPWTLLPGYTDGCRQATVALFKQRAALLREHTGVEKVDGLADGPLKQQYFLDWHPAATTKATQRARAEARL